MADDHQAGEEAQRVVNALEALMGMTDPKAQARAISQVLREQPRTNRELKRIRRDYVLGQRAAKVPFRTIAADLGVSLATVQDIVRDYSGSGRDRPRAGKAQHAESGETGG